VEKCVLLPVIFAALPVKIDRSIIDRLYFADADGCRGGVIQWAFDYVTTNDGINTAGVYPYVGKASAHTYMLDVFNIQQSQLHIACTVFIADVLHSLHVFRLEK